MEETRRKYEGNSQLISHSHLRTIINKYKRTAEGDEGNPKEIWKKPEEIIKRETQNRGKLADDKNNGYILLYVQQYLTKIL